MGRAHAHSLIEAPLRLVEALEEVNLVLRSMDEIDLLVVAVDEVDLDVRTGDEVNLVLVAVDEVDLVITL